MPDLSTLCRRNLLNLTMKAVLIGGMPTAVASATLLKNFVRLVDQCLESYELARMAFEAFIGRSSNTQFAEMFRAQGHMENCITALDRAVRHCERIRRVRDFAGVVPPLEVLTKFGARAVSDFRNAIEHGEERVLKGQIRPSDTVMLFMDDDAIEIEGLRITYEQLSNWLLELHGVASELTRWNFKG